MTDQRPSPQPDPQANDPDHAASPPAPPATDPWDRPPPTPEPAYAPMATAAVPPGDDAPTQTYTPEPTRRPEWTTATWGSPGPEQVPAPDGASDPWGPSASSQGAVGVPVERVAAAPPDVAPPSSRGLGTVIVAAVLAAILASGGTFVALNASGALNRTVTPATATTTTPAGARLPVTIDESSAIIDAAAKASPAVVQITSTTQATSIAGGTIPETGVGSGIIYDANGWVLTNRHVVTDESGNTVTSMTVELKDGSQYKGTVYGVDTLTDLAIVKIDAKNLPTAPIGSSSDLKVGQLAIAIGSPLGTYTGSVTSGIISAQGRSITVSSGTHLNNLIQTDAAINPGNSGGPLLDAAGNVIGINTATASGSNGIGFAIPIDIARPIMQQALAGKQLSRPYIGVRYVAIDLQLKQKDNLPVSQGALLGPGQDANGQSTPAVSPGSPAEKAGLKDGDVITGVAGQAIDTTHPLDLVLSQFSPGQTVAIDILRNGSKLTVQVTLGTRPANL
jgi:S1-C subfamily serine protease